MVSTKQEMTLSKRMLVFCVLIQSTFNMSLVSFYLDNLTLHKCYKKVPRAQFRLRIIPL
jgi:hypothetical protein